MSIQTTIQGNKVLSTFDRISPYFSFPQFINNYFNLKEAIQIREVLAPGTLSCFMNQLQKEMMESERGQEIIAKAEMYGIPCDKDTLYYDWLDLIERVVEYESLLSQAKKYNIDWDGSEYDPAALRQTIENKRHVSY
jgi:hypothetical protein